MSILNPLSKFSLRSRTSPHVISRFQSNSNVLYLINCGNKSKSFLSFISFILVTQHRVQVSCTSSSTSNFSFFFHAAYAAQYKLLSSFTNSFTAKAVPHMLSSVLTDAVQMLPSAVNSHTASNKYQYMFVKKLYITFNSLLVMYHWFWLNVTASSDIIGLSSIQNRNR